MSLDPDLNEISLFYDAYESAEWSRLETTAYGRLQAEIHADLLKCYVEDGMRVLDAGAGPGRFSIELARLGARVTVLDISIVQIALAQEKLRDSGLFGSVDRFVHGSITDLSEFADESFDAVVCYGGPLSYVRDDRERALGELVRVTRSEGLLLASVMSRFGAVVNAVRTNTLGSPGRDIYELIATADLPPFPSRQAGLTHPAMHLYESGELSGLFSRTCEVLELRGSNVTTFEGNRRFEEAARDPKFWAGASVLEHELGPMPGLVDSGSHLIIVARKRSAAARDARI